MLYKTRDEHLFSPGPKRILTLDGGGIRGALTLGYLARMEAILRGRTGNDPNFRLGHYFDLIAGTSTGSIIAAGLALGFSIEQLQELYQSLSVEVFKKPLWRFGLFSAKFPQEPLIKALTDAFGEVTLGSDTIKTGLLITAKRLDTGSPWIIHNNPRGKYFTPTGGSSTPNKDYLLREIIRASTAAPHYFEPESLQVAGDVTGAFVDGGVSPYNNPALPALMLAGLQGFGLNWSFGADKLMLVSAGTGTLSLRMNAADVLDMSAVRLAGQSILSIMADCDWLTQTMMQWMSNSPTAWPIDRETGDLQGDILGGNTAMLHYLRYNVRFDPQWLKQELNIIIDQAQADSLFAMDQPENVNTLTNLGTTAALAQVQPKHFPSTFDLT
jgi:hypothetical protein